jgi:hypothetical protein
MACVNNQEELDMVRDFLDKIGESTAYLPKEIGSVSVNYLYCHCDEEWCLSSKCSVDEIISLDDWKKLLMENAISDDRFEKTQTYKSFELKRGMLINFRGENQLFQVENVENSIYHIFGVDRVRITLVGFVGQYFNADDEHIVRHEFSKYANTHGIHRGLLDELNK